MHDRPESIPPSSPPPPPSVPSLTPDEVAAQIVIRWATAKLRLVILALRGVVAGLPVPEESEEMGTELIPESVSYSVAGTCEVIIHDDLLPALKSLHEASYLTPTAMLSAWERRVQEGRR